MRGFSHLGHQSGLSAGTGAKSMVLNLLAEPKSFKGFRRRSQAGTEPAVVAEAASPGPVSLISGILRGTLADLMAAKAGAPAGRISAPVARPLVAAPLASPGLRLSCAKAQVLKKSRSLLASLGRSKASMTYEFGCSAWDAN